ncbi:ester cyclase [Lampropedia puyangensis]|uniref:Ester cyclase n=1 Tax=Lampropedia puyangensis TaxID=1330072 RepID=A0A4S8FAZ4_9BURK|nr:ester cyclase [Lampropedia puyangensis]THU04151.1 ester cyclase [Lampropedia puyangensis]
MQTPYHLIASFYDAFNRNDVATFEQLLAPHWVNHPADPGQANTPDGFKRGVAQTHAAFEQFHITIEAVVQENDLIVARITMTGRHTSPFAGIAPSGQQVTFTGMDMHRISNNTIEETWHFENFDGLIKHTVSPIAAQSLK